MPPVPLLHILLPKLGGQATEPPLQLTNRRLQLSLITHQSRLKLHNVVKPIANGLDVVILRCARRRQGRSGSRGGYGQSRAHALEWRRMGTLGIGRVDSSSGFIGGRWHDGWGSNNLKRQHVSGDLKGSHAGVSTCRYDCSMFSLICLSSEQHAS